LYGENKIIIGNNVKTKQIPCRRVQTPQEYKKKQNNHVKKYKNQPPHQRNKKSNSQFPKHWSIPKKKLVPT
jgi:hypothetical protein